jgi:hypothetical protein
MTGQERYDLYRQIQKDHPSATKDEVRLIYRAALLKETTK